MNMLCELGIISILFRLDMHCNLIHFALMTVNNNDYDKRENKITKSCMISTSYAAIQKRKWKLLEVSCQFSMRLHRNIYQKN